MLFSYDVCLIMSYIRHQFNPISPLLSACSILYWIPKENLSDTRQIFFSTCSFSRPGCPVLTRRAATTGSRAPPPAPKVIRATSHTTRATARRGKMCETQHRKTSADRGDLALPPSPRTPTPVLVCNWLTVLSHFCCQTPASGGC